MNKIFLSFLSFICLTVSFVIRIVPFLTSFTHVHVIVLYIVIFQNVCIPYALLTNKISISSYFLMSLEAVGSLHVLVVREGKAKV
jgi:hypothetical protein